MSYKKHAIIHREKNLLHILSNLSFYQNVIKNDPHFFDYYHSVTSALID